MIIQVLGAFLGVISVSIIYGIDRKFFIYCGAGGAVGWMVYLLLGKMSHSEAFRIYCAAAVVALLAHIFARVFKAPVTIYLIPGILPLVPGLGMYRTVYYMIEADTAMASRYFQTTMEVAGCIALAIFTMDTFFKLLFGVILKKSVPVEKNRKIEAITVSQDQETDK